MFAQLFMNSCSSSNSCPSTCGMFDPVKDTVKLSPADTLSHHEEQKARDWQMDYIEEEFDIQRQRKRTDDPNRLSREQETEAYSRIHLKEVHDEDSKIVDDEIETLEQDAASSPISQEVHKSWLENERRVQEWLQAKERSHQEQEQERARGHLQAWLLQNRFVGVNARRMKFGLSQYPLHEAVTQKDSLIIKLLLRFGADATMKNSRGKTARDLAARTKGCEHLLAVFPTVGKARFGGA